MRAAVVLIIVFLLIGAAAITFWPSSSAPDTPSVPGQYPLNGWRFQWPVTLRTKAYRPAATLGSDGVPIRTVRPSRKELCGTTDTCPEPPM
jgi:hypothetical protein